MLLWSLERQLKFISKWDQVVYPSKEVQSEQTLQNRITKKVSRFGFSNCFVQALCLFARANKILQAENTVLPTGITLVTSYVENVLNFDTKQKFCDISDEVDNQIDAL